MTVATTMAITITLIVVIIISVGGGRKINATVLVYKPEDAIVRRLSIHFLAEAFLVNIGIIQGYVGLYRDIYGYIGLYRVI